MNKMDIKTCVKYLDYVSEECNRHLRDGRVTDDELVNFIIELDSDYQPVKYIMMDCTPLIENDTVVINFETGI